MGRSAPNLSHSVATGSPERREQKQAATPKKYLALANNPKAHIIILKAKPPDFWPEFGLVDDSFHHFPFVSGSIFHSFSNYSRSQIAKNPPIQRV